MAADEHDLAALHALFESEIKRIDQVLAEREKQVNLALTSSSRAIEKTEGESDRSRDAAAEWRSVMIDREKQLVPLTAHDRLQSEVNYIRKNLDQGAGRRAAWVAAAGIIATLLAVGIGQIISQGITSADVSNQIQSEAPWNRDKAQVERRITILEAQIQRVQIQISQLQGTLREHEVRDQQRDAQIKALQQRK